MGASSLHAWIQCFSAITMPPYMISHLSPRLEDRSFKWVEFVSCCCYYYLTSRQVTGWNGPEHFGKIFISWLCLWQLGMYNEERRAGFFFNSRFILLFKVETTKFWAIGSWSACFPVIHSNRRADILKTICEIAGNDRTSAKHM